MSEVRAGGGSRVRRRAVRIRGITSGLNYHTPVWGRVEGTLRLPPPNYFPTHEWLADVTLVATDQLNEATLVERKHGVRELPHDRAEQRTVNPRRFLHANGTVNTH